MAIVRDMLALLAVAAIVYGIWQFDWRFGIIAGGMFLFAVAWQWGVVARQNDRGGDKGD